jgi:peptide/nickel transport system substrate-binding protein
LLTIHRRGLALVLITATAGVCAAACARRSAPPEPVKLRIGVGTPTRGSRGSGIGGIINSLTSETWLTGRPDGSQGERIVSAYTWDDSRTVLHLKLRPDVYFHDGSKLTSEIAARALSDIAANAKNEGVLSFESIRSVTPSGADAVDVQLSEPNSFVVPDLALVALRKPGADRISTGPFRLVRREDQQAVLAAFPQYYRGQPSIAEIGLMNYPTQRNAWAAMMRGEIDMLYEVSRDAVEFVAAESTVRTYTFPRPYYIPLVFNARHPILKRSDVRKAINEALDREALVRDGLNGRGRPADGPIWPEHWAWAKTNPTFTFDPDSARRRLDAVGLRAKPGPAGAAAARFSFNCVVFAEDPRFERLAVLVQKQLADVGIEMNLLPLKGEAIEKRMAAGDFDALLFEMFGRSVSYAYDFWHSHEAARINTGYTAADAVLDKIRSARSDDDMREGVTEFARVLHEDPPAAFIAWQNASRAVSTRFNVEPERDKDILSNIWQWHLANGTTQASR